MPPTNDNIANAGVISGASGQVVGSNVGATQEFFQPGNVPEPYEWPANPSPTNPNPQPPISPPANPTGRPATSSVWFKWTCPADGDYIFETNFPLSYIYTNFPSYIDAFTVDFTQSPPSFSQITFLQNQTNGIGYQNGASVAFTASAGIDYYIRVDSRTSGLTGQFVLTWNTFAAERLGACGTCTLDFQSEQCVSTIGISDVTVDGLYSFGNFIASATVYRVNYCAGQFLESMVACSGTFEDASPPILKFNSSGRTGNANPVVNPDVFYPIGTVVFNGCGIYKSTSNVPANAPYRTTNTGAFQFSPSALWQYAGGYSGQPVTFPSFDSSQHYNVGDTTVVSFDGFNAGIAQAIVEIFPTTPGGVGNPYPPSYPLYWEGGNVTDSGINPNAICTPFGLCGTTQYFCHAGGAIGIVYPAAANSGAMNKTPNPTFQLIANSLTIGQIAVQAVNISPNGANNGNNYQNWNIAVALKNLSNIPFPITVEMVSGNGFSFVSSPVQTTLCPSTINAGNGFGITGNAPYTSPSFTFTADLTNQFCTATLQISMCGVVIGNLTIPLFPTITITAVKSGVPFVYPNDGESISGKLVQQYNVNLTYIPPTWFDPSQQTSIGGSSTSCAAKSADLQIQVTSQFNALSAAGGTVTLNGVTSFSIYAVLGNATSSNLHVNVKDTGLVYPEVVLPIVVPAVAVTLTQTFKSQQTHFECGSPRPVAFTVTVKNTGNTNASSFNIAVTTQSSETVNLADTSSPVCNPYSLTTINLVGGFLAAGASVDVTFYARGTNSSPTSVTFNCLLTSGSQNFGTLSFNANV